MALYIQINLDEAIQLRQLARGRDRNLVKQYTFALLYSGSPDSQALVPLALYYRIWDKGDPCDDCSHWLPILEADHRVDFGYHLIGSY